MRSKCLIHSNRGGTHQCDINVPILNTITLGPLAMEESAFKTIQHKQNKTKTLENTIFESIKDKHIMYLHIF